MKKNTPNKALEWSEKLKHQLLSGKNAASWCKEQGISYNTFQYWRSRFNKQNHQKTPGSPFVEIPQESFQGWIEILLPGARLTISKDFDRGALLFCLKVLGGH